MNHGRDPKEALKAIVRENLAHVASSLFLAKSIAIIDDSADTKESFIAAAVRISKRIALFIDRDLAQSVYEKIIDAIERNASPQGTRRKHRRVPFCGKVGVRINGATLTLDSEDISEGGIYLRTREPFPLGAEIEITLQLGRRDRIYVAGVVVRRNDPSDNASKYPPGMGVEFKRVGSEEGEILRSFLQSTPGPDGPWTGGDSAESFCP